MKKIRKLIIPLAIAIFCLTAIAATAGEQVDVDAYINQHYNAEQLNQTTTIPETTAIRIRTSYLPNGTRRPMSESINIVLMGDRFIHNQYYRSFTGRAPFTGTSENPAMGTVVWHANRAITALENTPPFNDFAHLFNVYVVRVATTGGANGVLGTVDSRGNFRNGVTNANQNIIRAHAFQHVPREYLTMIQVLSNAVGSNDRGAFGFAYMDWFYHPSDNPLNIAVTSLRTEARSTCFNLIIPGGENETWPRSPHLPQEFSGRAWLGTFIHEFGHSFGNLVDNHDSVNTVGDNFANAQFDATIYNSKWRHWFGHRNVHYRPVLLRAETEPLLHYPWNRTLGYWYGPSTFTDSGGNCIMRASRAHRYFNGVSRAELTRRLALISGETFHGRSPITANTIPNTPAYRYITIQPNEKNRILDSAFHGNYRLHTLTIPACIRYIGDFAFLETTGLRIIRNYSRIPQTLNHTTFSRSGTFQNIQNGYPNQANNWQKTLVVPSGASAAFRNAFIWREFNIIEMPAYTVSFDTNGGIDWDNSASPQIVVGASFATKPLEYNITKLQHRISHWALASDPQKRPFNFATTPIFNDVLLVAVWEYLGIGGIPSGCCHNPWQISSAGHLVFLAQEINAGNTSLAGAHFVLTGDIYLNDLEGFSSLVYSGFLRDIWLSDADHMLYSHGFNRWVPIGTAGNPFSGIFNGGGFSIRGMMAVGQGSQGLFGYVSDWSTIKNLRIEYSFVMGGENSGSVAGGMMFSDIINVYSSAIVRAASNTGGLVGVMYWSTVVNSTFAGTVYANHSIMHNGQDLVMDYVGGIAGFMMHSAVSESRNYANIYVANWSSSWNDGTFIGGIVGGMDFSLVVNNANRGMLVSFLMLHNMFNGGIVGVAYSNSIVTNNYSICNDGSWWPSHWAGGIVGLIMFHNVHVMNNFNMLSLSTGTGCPSVLMLFDWGNRHLIFNNFNIESMSAENILNNLNANSGGWISNMGWQEHPMGAHFSTPWMMDSASGLPTHDLSPFGFDTLGVSEHLMSESLVWDRQSMSQNASQRALTRVVGCVDAVNARMQLLRAKRVAAMVYVEAMLEAWLNDRAVAVKH